ncbi:MAG: Rpn family recombination-promoting nuclease/putative transposase [Spirochaetales bacterium]
MNKILYKGKELFSPKSDLVFKALFGKEDSKELLRCFLNSVLDLDIQKAEDITLTDTEMVAQTPDGKLSRLDVCAHVKNAHTSEHIDIEIQLSDQGDMMKRSVYYVAKLFSCQLEEGGSYTTLDRAIGLSILDFSIFDDDAWIHRGRLKDTVSGEEFSDCFEINFVEMPKLPTNTEPHNEKELWLMFLNAKNQEEIEMLIEKNTQIATAIDKLGIISNDEKFKHALIVREKSIRDYQNSMLNAEQRGLQCGLQRGEYNKACETAKKALKKNMDIALIADITGLSEEDIKAL